MRRFVVCLMLFGWLDWMAWAQSDISFFGKVVDEEGEGIAYATLLLSGSSYQAGAVADSSGRFRLAVVPDTYQCRIQCVGFNTLVVQREIHADMCDTLKLVSASQVLKEVAVTASRIERQADRFVLQIPPSLNQDGVELLRQAPGVWISDGRIGINGSFGTKIYIDDREVKMEGELLMAYLQSLRSEDIRQVEVLPLAGADKEAQSKGGAIHIRMRRSVRAGWKGNASLNTSVTQGFQRYQPHGSWSLHSGKWDWYGSTSLTYVPKAKGFLTERRMYPAADRNFRNEVRFDRPSHDEAIRTGLVFTPDSSHSLGLEVEYLHRFADRSSDTRSQFAHPSYTLYSIGDYRQQEKYDMVAGSLNYRYTKGHSVIKFLGDYISKKSGGNNRYAIRHLVEEASVDTLYRLASAADYQMASADVSWNRKVGKVNSWVAGLKYTFNGMRSDACTEGFLGANRSWVRIPAYDYMLDYHEHIAAAYVSYATTWKRLSLKTGIRAEYSRTADQTNQVRKRYLDLFPHVDLNFSVDELQRKLLVAQYARYVERPAFSALNPNRVQTSDFSYQVGNPALKPTYIDRFSLTFVCNYRYTFTIGGNLHRNLIREFTKQDEDNPDISFVTYENHYRENHWFVAVTVPWQPFDWFSLNANFVGVKQDIRMYRENNYRPHYLYFGNATATFFLPKDYSVEWQYQGASRLYSGNSEVNPYHTVNLLFRKKLKQGKWTLTLGVDNIFDRRTGYVCRVNDFVERMDIHSRASGRSFRIGAVYNFRVGKQTKPMSVEKNSSSERARLEK